MNQKQIGIIIIIAGIVLAGLIYIIDSRERVLLEKIVAEQGSCFLTDGTCLHESRNLTLIVMGGIVAFSLMLLGVYLLVFDKTQKVLAEHQVKVSSALEKASKKDEFNAFLAGFNQEEQEALKAIKEQEGIQQSTLRYRTGISKTQLSLMLKSFENRNIISRKVSGKTNEIFLVRKF